MIRFTIYNLLTPALSQLVCLSPDCPVEAFPSSALDTSWTGAHLVAASILIVTGVLVAGNVFADLVADIVLAVAVSVFLFIFASTAIRPNPMLAIDAVHLEPRRHNLASATLESTGNSRV